LFIQGSSHNLPIASDNLPIVSYNLPIVSNKLTWITGVSINFIDKIFDTTGKLCEKPCKVINILFKNATYVCGIENCVVTHSSNSFTDRTRVSNV